MKNIVQRNLVFKFKDFLNYREINEIGMPPLTLLFKLKEKGIENLKEEETKVIMDYLEKLMQKAKVEGDFDQLPYVEYIQMITKAEIMEIFMETFQGNLDLSKFEEKKKLLTPNSSLSPA